jgi:hypothetical protein
MQTAYTACFDWMCSVLGGTLWGDDISPWWLDDVIASQNSSALEVTTISSHMLPNTLFLTPFLLHGVAS